MSAYRVDRLFPKNRKFQAAGCMSGGFFVSSLSAYTPHTQQEGFAHVEKNKKEFQ
jgi:hypothetical protein